LADIAPGIGVVTTLLIYFIAKKMFNQRVAVVSSFLYAILPILVFFDKKFWNPSLTSLTAVILLFSVYWARRKKILWVLVAAVYGFAFHVHLSLVPLGVVLLYYLYQDRKKLNLAIISLGLVSFLLMLSPLIAFDYFTKGQNILTPFRVAGQVKDRPTRFEPIRHIKQLSISISRLFYLDPGVPVSDEVLHDCSLDYTKASQHTPGITTQATRPKILLSVVGILPLIFFFCRKLTWQDDNKKILALFIATITFFYILLPNIPLEYYLLGFFPYYLMVLGIVVSEILAKQKLILVLLLLVIGILGTKTVLTARDDYGLLTKKTLIEQVDHYLGVNSFDLDARGLCHRFEGWRFLFRVYGHTPNQSFTDEGLGWIYKDEIVRQPARYLVLITEDRLPGDEISEDYVFSFTQGGFTAYVYENEKNEN
jgi:4-amino-4-deoxy-L-arabinose transferase-like glycosyltransferase